MGEKRRVGSPSVEELPNFMTDYRRAKLRRRPRRNNEEGREREFLRNRGSGQ